MKTTYTLCIYLHSLYILTLSVYTYTMCIHLHSLYILTLSVYTYTLCIHLHSLYILTLSTEKQRGPTFVLLVSLQKILSTGDILCQFVGVHQGLHVSGPGDQISVVSKEQLQLVGVCQLPTLLCCLVFRQELAHTCIYLRTPVYTCTHLHIPVYTCIYLHTPVYTCTHLYIPAHTYVLMM